MLAHLFKPIIFKDTKILILGSLSTSSDNQFWKIMEMVTGYPTNNQDQKIWLFKESRVGHWDIIKHSYRDKSFDSSIEDEEVNDLTVILESYPNIERLALIGKKVEALFELHFGYLDIKRVYLPSPTYTKLNIEQKSKIYKDRLGL